MPHANEEFRDVAREVYDALLPACQDNYSKDILTAQQMMETGQGNCFTHAEAATLKLLGESVVRIAGIRLVLAPRRTNYHTESIAFGHNSEVAILDLIQGEPTYPDFNETCAVVHKTLLGGDSWIYTSHHSRSKTPEIAVRSPNVPYQWPNESCQQAVYMPADTGILAIHAIAGLGGMRNTVISGNQESYAIPVLPMN
ncbi:MAG TPA: hypothetical protein VK978_04830 [Candidatus Saccharimonadales bacterium]|nr:hypothetical protein [Candidatus Saccharimonadales bacterium]